MQRAGEAPHPPGAALADLVERVAMADRKYPIHGTPGMAWLLIYDQHAHQWMVETLTTDPPSRSRVTLEAFGRSECGQQMSGLVSEAVQRATLDI